MDSPTLKPYWIAAVECAIEISPDRVDDYKDWARVVWAIDEPHALSQVDRRSTVLNSNGLPVLS